MDSVHHVGEIHLKSKINHALLSMDKIVTQIKCILLVPYNILFYDMY